MFTPWTFTENLCLLLVWNGAETLQIPSGPTHPWSAKSLPLSEAFSGPERPHLGSQQVGSSHRSLTWGSRFVSVSFDGCAPRLPCPSLDIFNTVRVLFGCPQCILLQYSTLHCLPLHTVSSRFSTSTTCTRIFVAECASGGKSKPRQMWIIRVYILFRVSLWYISYSGVMKNL